MKLHSFFGGDTFIKIYKISYFFSTLDAERNHADSGGVSATATEGKRKQILRQATITLY